jgi:NAD(P)-dependent dehydrogenase (short-subunit alcohol dehydrogenase family)
MTKRFVIVGASTGLGRATATALVRAGADVIVAGRDLERTRAAVPAASAALRVDLADLSDVARFASELHGPIDGLICNAGVQTAGERRTTRDGFEETFAVNHLAHFSIVMRLAAQLVDGGRVVFVGSGTHDPGERFARRFGFRGGRYTSARELATGDGDPAADMAQRGLDAYATSKQCNLLAMRAIAARTTRFSTFAIDPGLMPGTNLARDRSWIERFAWNTIMRAMPGTSSARRSGRALAWIATSASLAGTTGRYFDYRRRDIEPHAIAVRDDWADELYAGSLELLGIADPLAADIKYRRTHRSP